MSYIPKKMTEAWNVPYTPFTVGDDCWEWTGKAASGYGAHRRVYEWLRGPVPEGLELDHLCRNKLCVRPDHLEPVTRAENMRRRVWSPPPNSIDEFSTHRWISVTGVAP